MMKHTCTLLLAVSVGVTQAYDSSLQFSMMRAYKEYKKPQPMPSKSSRKTTGHRGPHGMMGEPMKPKRHCDLVEDPDTHCPEPSTADTSRDWSFTSDSQGRELTRQEKRDCMRQVITEQWLPNPKQQTRRRDALAENNMQQAWEIVTNKKNQLQGKVCKPQLKLLMETWVHWEQEFEAYKAWEDNKCHGRVAGQPIVDACVQKKEELREKFRQSFKSPYFLDNARKNVEENFVGYLRVLGKVGHPLAQHFARIREMRKLHMRIEARDRHFMREEVAFHIKKAHRDRYYTNDRSELEKAEECIRVFQEGGAFGEENMRLKGKTIQLWQGKGHRQTSIK